jgi:hypothetical protein
LRGKLHQIIEGEIVAGREEGGQEVNAGRKSLGSRNDA